MQFTINWDYLYLFPCAIIICVLATSSGFSGSVLFQPIYYFVANVPLANSIATGIATETIGMSNGTLAYFTTRRRESLPPIDFKAVRVMLPVIAAGVLIGIYVFTKLPKDYLRLAIGVVIFGLGIYQLLTITSKSNLTEGNHDYKFLGKSRARIAQFFSGMSSACTGTGVAEISQPVLEKGLLLPHYRANATAICLEAMADIAISITNIKMGFLRYDILIFTVSGVLIGGQIGPRVAKFVNPRITRFVFSVAVLLIGALYIFLSLRSILFVS